MSNKEEWFLIYQNEHLGPYDEDTLVDLYNTGELTEDSLLWKEGDDEGQSYSSLFLKPETKSEFIPLEQISEIIVEEEPPALQIEAEDEDDSPPPFALEVEEESPPPFELEPEEEAPPPLPVFEEEVLTKPKRKIKFWHWKGLSVILLILFFVLQYLQTFQGDFVRPAGMGLNDYKRLLETTNADPSKNKFAFTLSRDKKMIWVSTNINLQGEVHFNFSNKNQENLGDSVVEIQGKGILKNNLIKISDFEFKQGTNFLDGFYDVDLFTDQDLSFPLIEGLFTKREKQFGYHGTVLISNLSQEKFEKVLSKKNEARGKNESEFFETLIEEYRTVQTITSQILAGLKSIFAAGDLNREEALTKFEDDYKKNYGVFFTSFVISVDKKYEVINEKEFEDKTQVIAHYAKLKKLALEVGAESSGQITELNSLNLIEGDASELKEIEFRSTLKFKEIIIECEKMIKELERGLK